MVVRVAVSLNATKTAEDRVESFQHGGRDARSAQQLAQRRCRRGFDALGEVAGRDVLRVASDEKHRAEPEDHERDADQPRADEAVCVDRPVSEEGDIVGVSMRQRRFAASRPSGSVAHSEGSWWPMPQALLACMSTS